MKRTGKYGLKFLEYIQESVKNYLEDKEYLIQQYGKIASIISFIIVVKLANINIFKFTVKVGTNKMFNDREENLLSLV